MKLEVTTPRGAQVSQEVDEVTIPGGRGEYGILPGHTPLLTTLRPGILSWKKAGQSGQLVIGAGVAEVSGDDRVIVLASESKKPADIDPAEARRALDEAERDIFNYSPPAPEMETETDAGKTAAATVSRDSLENRRLFAQACVELKAASSH